MAYSLLDPLNLNAELAGVCALAVMAKAPRAGKVKTRLAPALGMEGSAAINVCFLRDTARNIAEVAADWDSAAGVVCYTPVGDEAAFDGILPEGFALIAQRGDGFGERLLAAAEDVLACGFGAVCLIDSDSPTLPAEALREAVEALARPGDRVVLGGSEDGGYYLIGMKRAHAAPFERIAWSTGSVYAETVERCVETGLELVELPVWYDVDDAGTLAVLEAELLEGVRPGFATVDGYAAEATRGFLRERRAGQSHAAPTHDDETVMKGAPDDSGDKSNSGFPEGMTERKAWGAVASLREGRVWMTNVALCLLGVGLLLLARQFVSEDSHFTIGFSGVSGWSAVLYIAAIGVVLTQPTNRASFWIVVGFAVAFRVVTVFAEPFLSSDIYRYVWDGVVQHAHVNPYRYVPGDAALSYLRAPHQEVFDNINRRDYAHTIYPPVAQMIYWVVTLFSPTVTAMKVAMFGFECVTAGALLAMLRRLGRSRLEIVMYAWCPLLVWEIGGAGHVDAAVFALIALALLFRYREQPVLTGLFLGLAVMTKFYPVVLLPALYKRGDWKMPVTLAGVCVAAYAPYLSVGNRVFGFLAGYSKEEGIETGARYFLLEGAQSVRRLERLPVSAYLLFCLVVMGGLSVWAWRWATVEEFGLEAKDRSRSSSRMTERNASATPEYLRAAMMLAFAMMLLFSPHYPWYIVWLVPMFVLVPNLPLLAYLMGFFYLFTTALADPGPKMFLLNKILYGGVAVVGVVSVGLRRWWGFGEVRA
jgi:alpha-1,6-mannosyltransferase